MHPMLRGVTDVLGGAKAWRICWMLAKNDVVRRYRRSTLGQLWLTLSMAAMIFGMGLVYSLLFQLPLVEYLPYVGVSLILWNLISAILTESCTSFSENEGIIRQIALPKFTFIVRTAIRNILIFAHNFLIIPSLFLILWIPFNLNALLFLPGLLITLVNLAWFGFFLAILATRFRDVPPIVQSGMQLAFFISPVIFRPTQLPSNHFLLILNPFASMLDVMREPLMGNLPSLSSYAILIALAVAGWAATFLFAGKYAHRVVYWL